MLRWLPLLHRDLSNGSVTLQRAEYGGRVLIQERTTCVRRRRNKPYQTSIKFYLEDGHLPTGSHVRHFTTEEAPVRAIDQSRTPRLVARGSQLEASPA